MLGGEPNDGLLVDSRPVQQIKPLMLQCFKEFRTGRTQGMPRTCQGYRSLVPVNKRLLCPFFQRLDPLRKCWLAG